MFTIFICITSTTVADAYFNHQANLWRGIPYPHPPQYGEQPNNRMNHRQIQLIKNKIVFLANQTVESLDSQLIMVKKIHDNFKLNQMYRLGYAVSYVTEKGEEMTDLMEYVERNKGKFNVLKLLNAFDQIRKAKDTLSRSLLLLQQIKTAIRLKDLTEGNEGRDGFQPQPDPISWSYYDDAI